MRVFLLLAFSSFFSVSVFAADREVLTVWRSDESPLYFSAENYKAPSEKKEQALITQKVFEVMSDLPEEHTQSLQVLEVKNQAHVSRGMANAKRLILNTQSIDTEDELKAVTVHEIGHVVDLGMLKGEQKQASVFSTDDHFVAIDDVSLRFYKISWNNTDTLKKRSRRRDFVSGYAMTNTYEDFAETYAFYVLHGEKFRGLVNESFALKKKYYFMKNHIFNGVEFQKDKKASISYSNTAFDITLLAFGDDERKDLR